MQDVTTNNVVDYVDLLRNYTTTNIESIQKGIIPEVLDIRWKITDHYVDDTIRRYVFGKEEYVIRINGIRFNSTLPNRDKLVYNYNLKDAVSMNLIHPMLLFVNGRFIKWSDIRVIRDLKYSYLDIKNSLGVDLIDPIHITDVQVITIPFNIRYTENRNNQPLPKELFRFDQYTGELLDYGNIIISTDVDNIYYQQFKNLVGVTVKDVDLLFDKKYKLTQSNFINFKNNLLDTSVKAEVKNLNLITYNDGEPLQYDITTKFFYRDATNYNQSNITIPPNDGVLKEAIIDNSRPQLDVTSLSNDFDFSYRKDMLYDENFKKGIRYVARYNDAMFDDLYIRNSNIRTCQYKGSDIKKLINDKRHLIPAHDETVTKTVNIEVQKEVSQDYTYYSKVKAYKNPDNGDYVFNTLWYNGKLINCDKYDGIVLFNKNYIKDSATYDLTDSNIKKNLLDVQYKLQYTKDKIEITDNTPFLFRDCETDVGTYDIPTTACVYMTNAEVKRLFEEFAVNSSINIPVSINFDKFRSYINQFAELKDYMVSNLVDEMTNKKLSIGDWLLKEIKIFNIDTNDVIANIQLKDIGFDDYSNSTIWVVFDNYDSNYGYLGHKSQTNKLTALNRYYFFSAISDEIYFKQNGDTKVVNETQVSNKEETIHVPEKLSEPELIMPSGLHDRLDGYVMVYYNGELWDKYNRINYINDNFHILLSEDELNDIKDFDDFEVVHFDKVNNNYLTVDVVADTHLDLTHSFSIYKVEAKLYEPVKLEGILYNYQGNYFSKEILEHMEIICNGKDTIVPTTLGYHIYNCQMRDTSTNKVYPFILKLRVTANDQNPFNMDLVKDDTNLIDKYSFTTLKIKTKVVEIPQSAYINSYDFLDKETTDQLNTISGNGITNISVRVVDGSPNRTAANGDNTMVYFDTVNIKTLQFGYNKLNLLISIYKNDGTSEVNVIVPVYCRIIPADPAKNPEPDNPYKDHMTTEFDPVTIKVNSLDAKINTQYRIEQFIDNREDFKTDKFVNYYSDYSAQNQNNNEYITPKTVGYNLYPVALLHNEIKVIFNIKAKVTKDTNGSLITYGPNGDFYDEYPNIPTKYNFYVTDGGDITDVSIPYKDLLVGSNYTEKQIYFEYLDFTTRSVYDAPFSIDEVNNKIILDNPNYYGKTIYMASKRQFHYCFYNVAKPTVMFYMTKEFCFAKDPERYLFFINGRMITRNMYRLIIQAEDSPVTEPVIHSRILCEPGDLVEIFYVPEELKYIELGTNNKAKIVKTHATIDNQSTFMIPIPTPTYTITKDNFFVIYGSVIMEQDRYDVVGNNIIFKDPDDYIEYGRELTFVFIYTDNIAQNSYGAIKESDMLQVTVTSVECLNDGQTIFKYPLPYDGFDKSKAQMFVSYRGLYINPGRYNTDERLNTITLKDESLALQQGTNVNFVWIYPQEEHTLSSNVVRVAATIDNQKTFNVPVPYSNYFKEQNSFMVIRNGIFLNESQYSIDKNTNTLTIVDLDGLNIGQELVFNFFTGKELSVKTKQAVVTATKDDQQVFEIPEIFQDYNQMAHYFYIVMGDTYIDPRRYNINGSQLTFINDDDKIPQGRSLYFFYTYIEPIDQTTATIGDVIDGSKYATFMTKSVDISKDQLTKNFNLNLNLQEATFTVENNTLDELLKEIRRTGSPRLYHLDNFISNKDQIPDDVMDNVKFIIDKNFTPSKISKKNLLRIAVLPINQESNDENITNAQIDFYVIANCVTNHLISDDYTIQTSVVGKSDLTITESMIPLFIANLGHLPTGTKYLFTSGKSITVTKDYTLVPITVQFTDGSIINITGLYILYDHNDDPNIEHNQYPQVSNAYNTSDLRVIVDNTATFSNTKPQTIIKSLTDFSNWSDIVNQEKSLTIPIPKENAAINKDNFFVTVGSTFINSTNYTINRIKNTITFKRGTVDIKQGRHVYFTFIDSKYSVIETQLNTVTSEADGQLEFNIPLPFDNFFTLGNNCIVYINNVYFDPDRYTIDKENNKFIILNEEDGIPANIDVAFMFFYTSNSQNHSYKNDEVQYPKLTKYGYIYLDNQEVRHTMNTKLFFLFVNGKKIKYSDILVIANNIIKITRDPSSRYNAVFLDYTPDIPELDEYKNITSDYDLIMNNATMDDLNAIYNEYTTLTDIERHIKPDVTQESIINNIIANHYMRTGISYGKPFVYTYDLPDDNVSVYDENMIVNKYIKPGYYDLAVPVTANTISFSGVSPSSRIDNFTSNDSPYFNDTKVHFGRGCYVIPSDKKEDFKSALQNFFAVSSPIDKGYKQSEQGYENNYLPIRSDNSTGKTNRDDIYAGRFKVKNFSVVPGSRYRITVPKNGLCKIGYKVGYTKTQVPVSIDYDSNNNTYSINWTEVDTNGTSYVKNNQNDYLVIDNTIDYNIMGQYEFTVPENVFNIVVCLVSGFSNITTNDGKTIEYPDMSAIQLSGYQNIDFIIPDVPKVPVIETYSIDNFYSNINGVKSFSMNKLSHVIDGQVLKPFSNSITYGQSKVSVSAYDALDDTALKTWTDKNYGGDYSDRITNMYKNGVKVSYSTGLKGVSQDKSFINNDKITDFCIYIPAGTDGDNSQGAVSVYYNTLSEVKDDKNKMYTMNTMTADEEHHPDLDFEKYMNSDFVKNDELDHKDDNKHITNSDALDKDNHPTYIGTLPKPTSGDYNVDNNIFTHSNPTED